VVKDKEKMAETSVANIPINAIVPFDPRKVTLLMGSVEYVALEVLVSKLARFLLKAPKGWGELAMVHALSLPFMGGIVGFMDDNRQLNKSKKAWGELFMDGAKGIPAVLLAQWVINTFYSGFQFPWFNMKDLLITAGAKTITRPLTGFIVGYLPNDAKDALETVDNLVRLQAANSNLRSKSGSGV